MPGAGEESAFGADEEGAAVFGGDGLAVEEVGGGELAAVIPGHFHGWFVAARGEVQLDDAPEGGGFRCGGIA